MEQKIYSVFDKKSGIYGQPQYSHNKGTAIRSLTSFLQSGDTDPAKYPEDFCLYELGTFNDNTGTITPHNPQAVIELAELKGETNGNNNDNA